MIILGDNIQPEESDSMLSVAKQQLAASREMIQMERPYFKTIIALTTVMLLLQVTSK